MENFIDTYLSGDSPKLKGLEINGTIPFNDQLLNEFMQEEISNFRYKTSRNNQSNKSDKKYSDLLKYLKMKVGSKQGRVVISVQFHVK